MSNMGEWYLTVVDANCVKGFDLFSKSDLYVQINFGGKSVKTKSAKNQESPSWNETFAFPYNNNNSNVEIIVTDDDIFKDDIVSVANISYKQFPTFGEEKEYSIPLSYKHKDIGILHIRMRNGGKNISPNYDNNTMTSSNMVSSSSQQQYPSSTLSPNNGGGYDSTVLGGHSYHDNGDNTRHINTNMNDINNNNTHVIYHNVTEHRTFLNDIGNTDHTLFSHADHGHNGNVISNNNDIGHTNIPHQQHDISPVARDTHTNTHIHTTTPTTTLVVMPPSTNVPIPTGPVLNTGIHHNNNDVMPTLVPSTEITKKVRKHKNRDVSKNLHLPEKHHHYEDGYTSSSSESSNEGEKERALEHGKELDTDEQHYAGHHGSHKAKEHPIDI